MEENSSMDDIVIAINFKTNTTKLELMSIKKANIELHNALLATK